MDIVVLVFLGLFAVVVALKVWFERPRIGKITSIDTWSDRGKIRFKIALEGGGEYLAALREAGDCELRVGMRVKIWPTWETTSYDRWFVLETDKRGRRKQVEYRTDYMGLKNWLVLNAAESDRAENESD